MRSFGKYRLVEPLASGGMADVWRAEVVGAEGVVKEVALKLVRGEHAEKSAFVRMFVQEARLAARLSHANVVQVFEFDQVDGRYYIAMELVRGRHLGQVAERAREAGVRFGLARAVHVAAEVARALAYAHRRSDGGRPLGLVHRDVSPHNVLVSFEGEVKLADFGIARAMNLGELTEPGTLKGKVAYMAPEQARGAPVDARADVFSVGVILWELCAGRRLFAREGEAATLAAVLSDEPLSPPSAWNDEVPPALDAAVLGALERDPARRTGSAQDLATALAGVLLRLARAPEDVDLRLFMHRLFEREAALAASGAPAQEPTAVRPVAIAREPQAEPSGPAQGAGPAPGGAAQGDAGAEEAVTRTAARPRRRAAVAGAAVAAAVAAAAALAPRGEGGPPRGAGAPAAAVEGGAATAPDGEPLAARAAGPGGAGAGGEAPASESPPGAPGPATEAAPAGERAPPGAAPDRPAPVAPRAVRPLESASAVGALRLPPPGSGEGILSVNAARWGHVFVNGVALGETPREVRLPAGRYRVRIERRNERAVEADVTVRPGARATLYR